MRSKLLYTSFLLPTSYFLLPTSYFLLPTSVFVLGFKATHKFHQRTYRYAAGALGDPGFVFLHPGHACDVEVDPRGLIHELFEEHCSGDGATPAPAAVHDVGNTGTDH